MAQEDFPFFALASPSSSQSASTSFSTVAADPPLPKLTEKAINAWQNAVDGHSQTIDELYANQRRLANLYRACTRSASPERDIRDMLFNLERLRIQFEDVKNKLKQIESDLAPLREDCFLPIFAYERLLALRARVSERLLDRIALANAELTKMSDYLEFFVRSGYKEPPGEDNTAAPFKVIFIHERFPATIFKAANCLNAITTEILAPPSVELKNLGNWKHKVLAFSSCFQQYRASTDGFNDSGLPEYVTLYEEGDGLEEVSLRAAASPPPEAKKKPAKKKKSKKKPKKKKSKKDEEIEEESASSSHSSSDESDAEEPVDTSPAPIPHIPPSKNVDYLPKRVLIQKQVPDSLVCNWDFAPKKGCRNEILVLQFMVQLTYTSPVYQPGAPKLSADISSRYSNPFTVITNSAEFLKGGTNLLGPFLRTVPSNSAYYFNKYWRLHRLRRFFYALGRWLFEAETPFDSYLPSEDEGEDSDNPRKRKSRRRGNKGAKHRRLPVEDIEGDLRTLSEYDLQVLDQGLNDARLEMSTARWLLGDVLRPLVYHPEVREMWNKGFVHGFEPREVSKLRLQAHNTPGLFLVRLGAFIEHGFFFGHVVAYISNESDTESVGMYMVREVPIVDKLLTYPLNVFSHCRNSLFLQEILRADGERCAFRRDHDQTPAFKKELLARGYSLSLPD